MQIKLYKILYFHTLEFYHEYVRIIYKLNCFPAKNQFS